MIAERMENTGKVRGVFELDFDKREFSAVHIMDCLLYTSPSPRD